MKLAGPTTTVAIILHRFYTEGPKMFLAKLPQSLSGNAIWTPEGKQWSYSKKVSQAQLFFFLTCQYCYHSSSLWWRPFLSSHQFIIFFASFMCFKKLLYHDKMNLPLHLSYLHICMFIIFFLQSLLVSNDLSYLYICL